MVTDPGEPQGSFQSELLGFLVLRSDPEKQSNFFMATQQSGNWNPDIGTSERSWEVCLGLGVRYGGGGDRLETNLDYWISLCVCVCACTCVHVWLFNSFEEFALQFTWTNNTLKEH